MTKEELDKVLESHKKWLHGNCCGKRADLCGADLSGANLYGADLYGADLCGADLSGASLYGADLHGAYLICANLCGANLRDATLYDATLYGANLSGADLRGADLHGVYLHCANLCEANLKDADLCDADIDFSVWPLCCGGLDVHIGDRIAIQLLYHLVRNVLYSKNTSEELKSLLGQKDIVRVANQFHRVDECGRIELTEQCQ